VITALSSPDLIESIGEYFYEQTKELINANRYVLVDGRTAGVDLTRCVFKTLPVSWAATELVRLRGITFGAKLTISKAGIVLKSKGDSDEYTALGLSDALGDIYE
jgi:linoleate 10R-lipoxygenase